MERPTDSESLRKAWRALAGIGQGDGWRTIPIEVPTPSRLLAGRHFPGDEESVLVGFRDVRMPPEAHLPQGRGFQVSRVPSAAIGSGHQWLALSRRSEGSIELFAMMAADVVGLLDACASEGEERLFQIFLSRIRAWQDFMDRGRNGVLSPEAEVGLFGEIVIVMQLLGEGMPARLVLESWQGPLDREQDFFVGSGAIEVKTTLSQTGFPATVSSLDQLDETLVAPLFVAAVRLALKEGGTTLPGLVSEVRVRLEAEPSAAALFDCRLVQAGYLQAYSHCYARCFEPTATKLIPVKGSFPRLTRTRVAPGVTKARYEVDLDLAGLTEVGLGVALTQMEGL